MFSALGITIRQILAAITKLASAAEKGASALDHLGTWGEEAAGAFADEARVERQKKQAALAASVEAQRKALDAQATADTKAAKKIAAAA